MMKCRLVSNGVLKRDQSGLGNFARRIFSSCHEASQRAAGRSLFGVEAGVSGPPDPEQIALCLQSLGSEDVDLLRFLLHSLFNDPGAPAALQSQFILSACLFNMQGPSYKFYRRGAWAGQAFGNLTGSRLGRAAGREGGHRAAVSKRMRNLNEFGRDPGMTNRA